MARDNFYEMLKDLSPYEQDPAKIQTIINQWYQQISNRLNLENDPIKKQALSTQASLKQEMDSILLNPGLRAKEANAYIRNKKIELDSLAVVMSDGKPYMMPISSSRTQKLASKFSLTQSDVNVIFESHNFKVQQTHKVNFDQYFIHDMDEINQYIKNNQYPWLTKTITNLYELLACYNKQPQIDYSTYSTDDLYMIASKGNDELFKKAKTIFSSEENRIKYDNSLKLLELNSFLNTANQVPYAMKKDENYAETVIAKIQTRFPDYDLALAIYNHQLNLLSDPYEPEKALIHVSCGNCQASMTYPSESIAIKEKCPVCGEPFYKKCPSCGKIIASSLRKRSYCDMDLMEYQKFDIYYDLAMEAIQNQDIHEANLYINKAKNANPKSNQLVKLDNNLKAMLKIYDEPLKKLQNYIDHHEYFKAQDYIMQLQTQYPKLNLTSQQSSIQSAINRAQQMFNQKGTNQYEAANRCIDILKEVNDFLDAKEYINKVPPRVSNVFNKSMTSQGVQLNWSASLDKGVSYVLVRNTQHMPNHDHDGEVLLEAENQLQYLDNRVESGLTYNYALFVKREGTISSPLTTSLTLYTEISQATFNYFLDNHKVTFNWALPKNALGIRILRSRNHQVDNQPTSNTICLVNKAYNSYSDTVETGIPYQYRFQVIYQTNGKEMCTNGLIQDIIYEDIPSPTTITNVKYDDNTRKITMMIQSSTTKPYKVQVINLEHPFGEVNEIINASSINKYGKIVAIGDSHQRQLEMIGLRNVGYQLGIVTIAGSKAVLGNVVHVSTFDRCEINKTLTKIFHAGLSIHMVEPIASNITSFYYACNVKDTSSHKPPYLTVDDLDMMDKVTINQYNQRHNIVISSVPEKELYITVIGEINENGQTYYTSPAKLYINNSPKTKLQYSIEWKGTFKKKRTDAILHIQSNDVLLDDYGAWPNLYLVARNDGRIPKQRNVRGTIVIAKLDENSRIDNRIRMSNGGHSMEIMFDVPDSVPSKAAIRLFLDDLDEDDFELEAVNEKNLIVP